MNFQLTLKSENRKLGPIPTSISSSRTCPSACPFNGHGCYAEQGPLAWHWAKVTQGTRGLAWEAFLQAVRALPQGQFWRHNQAGDLPGLGNSIAPKMLAELVEANQGKAGFTFTHKPMDTERNRQAVQHANENGFVVNLSANSLKHADELASLGIAPVAVVLPADHKGNTMTPAGRKVVQCPATRDGYNVTCNDCRLCAKATRSCIVGFPAHGPMKRAAEKATEEWQASSVLKRPNDSRTNDL